MRPLPVQLFERGFLPLVSVIPPNAPLSPTSRVQPSQRGKTPGRRNANGTWAGYGWLKHETTIADVKKWSSDGSNIGILAEYYPGVDIDSLDAQLSAQVARIARKELGPAPSRVGRAPKQLLMYRTEEPFARMAVILRIGEESHLVEVLGAGRQYLIYGDHPGGSRYEWDTALFDPSALTSITSAAVERFFDAVEEEMSLLDINVERVGDGKLRDRSQHPQADFLAPSLDALRECVEAIPNTDELFPTRDEYVKMGYAICAAAGDMYDEGFEVFAEWCARHEQDGRVAGNPDTWRADWERMAGPFSVGWGWLAETAAPHGFNSAGYEFEVDELAVLEAERERDDSAPDYSDAWLAEQVIAERGHQMRYVPASNKWYVWNGGRWEPDAVLLADHLIGKVLQRIASKLMRSGVSPRDQAKNAAAAGKLCSAPTHRNVRHVLRSDPRITATPDAFDFNHWILNTPGGMVDLVTGDIVAHDPNELCSRITRVAPDADMLCPEWKRFLVEATGHDTHLQLYMQRLAGYALTGSIEEQMLAFVWGSGGNGKGTWLNTIMEVMHDYAVAASMDTFTSSKYDKHSSDIAGLAGARLVSAIETEHGKRWDEQRVKSLTGGDPIRAHFMRQDYFTYLPQFTLIFAGNHKPEIRSIDAAIKRRFHLVPFTITPKQIDGRLRDKLREEYPAILHWCIEGCLAWQQQGLNPPEAVRAATHEYFADEDPIQRWIDEVCVRDAQYTTPMLTLFRSWEDWAGARGEHVGNVKRLSQILLTKKYERVLEKKTRRSAFEGLAVRDGVLDLLL